VVDLVACEAPIGIFEGRQFETRLGEERLQIEPF
jgi:hypothetical protein